MVKTLKIFVILASLQFGEAQVREKQHSINPVLKSFMVPGWGQYDLNKTQRGNKYLMLEGTLILTYWSSLKISKIQKNNYIAYAVEHANLSKAGKDHNYWVDIGNYNSLEEYNSEHLRNRENDALYSNNSTWSWNWNFNANRTNFEKRRINSDRWKQAAKFLGGGIVLNHIISVIDVVYLRRLQKLKLTQKEIKLELEPEGIGICLYF